MIYDNKSSLVAVLATDSNQSESAAKLASELQIPLTNKKGMDFRFLLICSADSLELLQTGTEKPNPSAQPLRTPLYCTA